VPEARARSTWWIAAAAIFDDGLPLAGDGSSKSSNTGGPFSALEHRSLHERRPFV
jgi:hypothetical protein